MLLATHTGSKNKGPRRGGNSASGGRVVDGFDGVPRAAVYCLVAYRDEKETRAEANDWSGSPLAAGGGGVFTPATPTGEAIDQHLGRVFEQFFNRSHE